METIYVFFAVAIISLISQVGIVTLALKGEFLKKAVSILVALSVGALFGDVFLHIIPQIYENDVFLEATPVLIITGILIFFVLEKFLLWRHSHGRGNEHALSHIETKNVEPIGYVVLVSDAVHNFIDGVIIAAAFLIDLKLGIATTLAIALHEIPQELGNFAILVHAGFSKIKALIYNLLSALTAFLGAIIVLYGAISTSILISIILPIAAGSFIYIAGSDLVPELHKTSSVKKSIADFLAILGGLIIMLWLRTLE